jgi:predicted transcriptional regulator
MRLSEVKFKERVQLRGARNPHRDNVNMTEVGVVSIERDDVAVTVKTTTDEIDIPLSSVAWAIRERAPVTPPKK